MRSGRWTGVLLVAALSLGACDWPEDEVKSSKAPDHCPAPRVLSKASSLPVLKKDLRHDVSKRVRSLRMQGKEDGYLYIDLLDAKGNLILQAEVEHQHNGRWIAREPVACM